MKRVTFWPHMVNTFKKLQIYAEPNITFRDTDTEKMLSSNRHQLVQQRLRDRERHISWPSCVRRVTVPSGLLLKTSTTIAVSSEPSNTDTKCIGSHKFKKRQPPLRPFPPHLPLPSLRSPFPSPPFPFPLYQLGGLGSAVSSPVGFAAKLNDMVHIWAKRMALVTKVTDFESKCLQFSGVSEWVGPCHLSSLQKNMKRQLPPRAS